MSTSIHSDPVLQERRERVFLVLAGTFLCAMTLLNVIGITRFVELGPLQLAVGVLPYPLTFLCTDLICELYGRSRATFLVSLGLCLNVFIIGVMWLGNALPAVPMSAQPAWQTLELAQSITLASGADSGTQVELFRLLYECTAGAVFASMLAYVAAQYADVRLFHFWKRLTRGKYLWVRNNFSTLISQMIDSIAVISITFGALFIAGEISLRNIAILMLSNYLFKMLAALLDTLPFYILVGRLKRYLQIDNLAVD
ncbi:MAG TPA: queuosine precursor transporter [Spongiibacteraceae bacterium]|nr:queuosine precursor transporter [Spongiibacteraceae bacterium]HUH37147.1 queuosine precursor transporter [Spongiibacteraceae bacterium]